MPKIEVSANGNILIDNKPFNRGNLELDVNGDFTRVGIFHIRNQKNIVERIPITEYTDNLDASFASYQDFIDYLDPFFFRNLTGGGGGGTGWAGEVNTFADLPAAGDNTGSTYLVKTKTGSQLTFNLKRSGFYQSDGVSWTKLNQVQFMFTDDELTFKDSADNTKQLGFELNQITTGTRRTATFPDKDITLDDQNDSRPPTSHASTHTNGTDDIQDATTSQKGLMTATQATKLSGIATGANNYTHPNHSGEVTSLGDGATTIQPNVVSNTKLSDMAANTVKVRNNASSGDPVDLSMPSSTILARLATGNIVAATVAQATDLLNVFTTSLKGLVPASGGGTTNFLRADGTWAAPSGGGGGVSVFEGFSAGISGNLSGNTNYTQTFTVTGASVGDKVDVGLNDTFYNNILSSSQDISIIGKVTSANTVQVLFRIEQFLSANTNRQVWARIVK